MDRAKSAFLSVEQNEAYIVDVLCHVISVDTSVPPGENYNQLIDQVEPDFKRFGFQNVWWCR